VTGPLVVAAARAGVAAPRSIVERVGWRLGVGIAGLVNVLDPELVVVGGGVAGAGDLLLEPARRAFAETVEAHEYRPEVPIVEAGLGTDSVAIGAALMAVDGMVKAGA
jgi:glucokinase